MDDKQSRDLKEQPFKNCILCNKAFTRRLSVNNNIENWTEFGNRKYCSNECRYTKNKFPKPKAIPKIKLSSLIFKKCIGCTTYFTKHIHIIKGKYPISVEATTRFNARVYCCRECFKNNVGKIRSENKIVK